MKTLSYFKTRITRQEANFDRACDEVHQYAIWYFGIDEDGHSNKLPDWERNCRIEIEFTKYISSYTRVGSTHVL